MQKIKKFFSFIGRAWSGSIRGKAGIFCALFAMLAFSRLFLGEITVQKFIGDGIKYRAEQKQLAENREKSDAIGLHIRLLQEYDADYIEELAQKYLNMGDPQTRILKL
jgi:cell division protein FtsB